MSVLSMLMPWHWGEVRRLRSIAGVLARHGLADVAARLGPLAWVRSVWRGVLRRGPAQDLPIERRIRRVLEELGPTFVKLGQMLATRPDLVPVSLVEELRHLQDEVEPFPFEGVIETIREDLGREWDEVFRSIDPVPIAAASIAQVHRAVLRDGREVVIKVQRPSLEGQISADLRLLRTLAHRLEEGIPESRIFRPLAIVEEFTKSLRRETDFRTEAHSMMRYARNFADEPGLKVPEPLLEASGRRVLTMERVEGVKVSDREALEAMGVDLRALVELGMRITMRSIFEFGFFHADPHPGNFFVRSDGTIVLLDFGMMGTLEPRRIDEILGFLVAVLTGDVEMVVDQLVEADLVSDETDLRALRTDLRSILVRYQDVQLGDVDVAGFLQEVSTVTVRHHVMLPTDLLLVGKSVATMEGLGHQVYPEFRPLEAIRPYLTEVYVQRMLDAKKHSQAVARTSMDLANLLKDAPFEIRRVLRKIRKGEFAIQVRSPAEPARRALLGTLINRVILAVLFPAFFFGSVVLLEQGGTWSTWAGWTAAVLAWFFLLGLLWSFLTGDGR